MSATYVAWNGQSYPWPPPEGWYLASDGQWWAPGTGPNPPSPIAPAEQAAPEPVDAATPGVASSPQPEAESAIEEQHTRIVGPPDGQDATTPQQLATPQQPLATPQQQPGLEQSAAAPQSFGNPQPLGTPQAGAPVQPFPGTSSAPPNNAHAAPPGGAVWQQQQPQQHPQPSSGGSQKGLLIGLGAFLGLIGLGVITLILTGGDDSSDPGTALEAAEEDVITTTTIPPSTTTAEQVTTSTITTTTIPPTTIDESTTTVAVVSEEAQVAAYRARLDEDGLTAEQLSDEDVVEFGTSFCIFATIADDADAFDTFREQAIAESDGDLTVEELNLAIDNAIIVFCPEEAERLGIS